MPGPDPERAARQLDSSDGWARASAARGGRRSAAVAPAPTASTASAAAASCSAGDTLPEVQELPSLVVTFEGIELKSRPRENRYGLVGERLARAVALWDRHDKTPERERLRREWRKRKVLEYRKADDNARRVRQRNESDEQMRVNAGMCQRTCCARSLRLFCRH